MSPFSLACLWVSLYSITKDSWWRREDKKQNVCFIVHTFREWGHNSHYHKHFSGFILQFSFDFANMECLWHMMIQLTIFEFMLMQKWHTFSRKHTSNLSLDLCWASDKRDYTFPWCWVWTVHWGSHSVWESWGLTAPTPQCPVLSLFLDIVSCVFIAHHIYKMLLVVVRRGGRRWILRWNSRLFNWRARQVFWAIYRRWG